MPLTKEQIESIRQRADVTQIIGSYVTLKKSGRRYVGLCPFHNEKTPSFSVTPDKGLYYCFGCRVGGDVFDFIMRHQGLDFHGAARDIAEKVGVALEAESPQRKKQRKLEGDIVRVNEFALAFFRHALGEPQGRQARAYLSERRVDPKLSDAWQLGYGGHAGALLVYLKAKNVSADLAAKAGLLTDDGKRCLFDERVVFPIHDNRRRLVGFGGRRLGDHGPKYINTREGPLFAKRHLLYGWTQAEDTLRREKRAILVEGYMDVLACHRAGLTGAVAALGTAFTEEHAKECARITKDAVALFDGDTAGRRAARDAAVRLLREGIKTHYVALPPGDDPDSIAREFGADGLRQRVAKATPIIEYFMDAELAKPGLSIEERAEAVSGLGPMIFALAGGLERDLYIARLAERLGVTEQQVHEHLRRSMPRKAPVKKPAGDSSEAPKVAETPPEIRPQPTRFELNALRDLLLYPQLRPRFGELAEYATPPMMALLDDLATGGELKPILEAHLTSPKAIEKLSAIAAIDPQIVENIEESAERTFKDVLDELKIHNLRAALADTKRELGDAELRGEDTEERLRRIRNLDQRINELKHKEARAQRAGA